MILYSKRRRKNEILDMENGTTERFKRCEEKEEREKCPMGKWKVKDLMKRRDARGLERCWEREREKECDDDSTSSSMLCIEKKHDDDVFEEVIIVSRVSSALMRVFHQREWGSYNHIPFDNWTMRLQSSEEAEVLNSSLAWAKISDLPAIPRIPTCSHPHHQHFIIRFNVFDNSKRTKKPINHWPSLSNSKLSTFNCILIMKGLHRGRELGSSGERLWIIVYTHQVNCRHILRLILSIIWIRCYVWSPPHLHLRCKFFTCRCHRCPTSFKIGCITRVSTIGLIAERFKYIKRRIQSSEKKELGLNFQALVWWVCKTQVYLLIHLMCKS